MNNSITIASELKTMKKNESIVASVPEFLKIPWFAGMALLEKKANDVIVIDLRNVDGAPSDFFLIASCDSSVHVKAASEYLRREWTKQSLQSGKSEGWDASEWIILDYFDLVVHVFQNDKREFYKLEKLWSDGEFFRIEVDGTIVKI